MLLNVVCYQVIRMLDGALDKCQTFRFIWQKSIYHVNIKIHPIGCEIFKDDTISKAKLANFTAQDYSFQHATLVTHVKSMHGFVCFVFLWNSTASFYTTSPASASVSYETVNDASCLEI